MNGWMYVGVISLWTWGVGMSQIDVFVKLFPRGCMYDHENKTREYENAWSVAKTQYDKNVK
jgi:hypothetical protein